MSLVWPTLAIAAGVYFMRHHREDSDSDSDCGEKPIELVREVPPRRVVYADADFGQYANDPTVRKGRSVDKSLYGVDNQEERVIPRHPIDTIPIDPVGDPLWKNRRRGRMVISRDERDAVPLVQSQYQQPFAMSDDSDFRTNELRRVALDRVPQHQELWWDNVSLAPRATEWAPDPNLMLQSVAFKQSRRMLGDTTLDMAIPTRQPIAQPDESSLRPQNKPAITHSGRRQDSDVRNINSKLPATYGIQA